MASNTGTLLDLLPPDIPNSLFVNDKIYTFNETLITTTSTMYLTIHTMGSTGNTEKILQQ